MRNWTRSILLSLLLASLCFAPPSKPIRGVQISRTHRLAKNLVGCWLMNEGTGNKVYDLSGNRNHGILYGDTHWVAGKHGPCLSFDGNGDYVEIDNYPHVKELPYTVTCWAKAAEDNPVAEGAVFFYGNSADGADYLRITFTTDGFIRAYNRDTGSSVVTTIDYADGNWHFIAVTVYHPSAVWLKLYVDNAEPIVDESPSRGPDITSTYNRVAIGMLRDVTPALPFHGLIDDVGIYDRELGAEEIGSLHADPFQIFRYSLPVELFTYVEAVGDITVYPNALALSIASPSPSIVVPASVSPSALSLAATLGTPEIQIASTAEATVIPLTGTVEAPEVQIPSTVSPAALALTGALGTPLVEVPATVSPTAQVLSSSVETPTIGVPVSVTPMALPLNAALAAPQLNYGASVSVNALGLTEALQQPTVQTGLVVSSSVLTLSSTLQAPAIAYGSQVDVSASALTASLPSPTVTTGLVFQADSQALTASVQSPQTQYGCQFTVNQLEMAIALEEPSLAYGSVLLPTAQQIQGTLGSVQVSYGCSQTVSALALTGQIPLITVQADVVIEPSAQALVGTLAEPIITTTAFQVAWALNLWKGH